MLYGSAVLYGSFKILPETYLERIDLTDEMGLKAYVAWFTYSKSFAYSSWNLYINNRVQPRGLAPNDPLYAVATCGILPPVMLDESHALPTHKND